MSRFLWSVAGFGFFVYGLIRIPIVIRDEYAFAATKNPLISNLKPGIESWIGLAIAIGILWSIASFCLYKASKGV